MSEQMYSVKEILDIQFKNLHTELVAIRDTLKEQNVNTEKRFSTIEKELDDIRKKQEEQSVENARYKTIWGIGATVGASLIAIISNRIF